MFDHEDLIPLARAGDREAFGRVVRANYNRVYRVVCGQLGPGEEAREVTQLAWVKAWQKLDGFRGESAFSTWVFRIATRLAWDVLRRKRKEKAEALDETSAAVETPPEQLEVHPRRELERREIREHFQKALDAMPPKHREVLVLREVEGLRYEEIANVLGISPGTVMSRIYNARKLIQPYLKDFL